MGETNSVRAGDTDIEYHVTRSPRRTKTIQIAVDPERGVVVSSPVRVPDNEIAALVRRRAAWILQRLREQPTDARQHLFLSGESMPYLGQEVRLDIKDCAGATVRLRFEPWTMHVAVPQSLSDDERPEAIRRNLEAWYRLRARERLDEAVARFAPIIGAQPTAVFVRDQRRRWGSCSASGSLRFNWRIVMAEPALMDYVVVHELSHLHHPNHSRSFWAQVAKVVPDYAVRRARLRELGPQLSL